MALESQSWGQHYMAIQLASVLREHGRECHVIRVPHSSPSLEQAAHVRLDRASPKALRILGELGKLDGDIDVAMGLWASSTVSAMVADMFMDMPATTDRSRADSERRVHQRVVRDLPLGAGLVLKDQSPSGACLLIMGQPPVPGTAFVFAAENGAIRGSVRWVQTLQNDSALFGVEVDTLTV
jgi:hypothetical protein